MDMDDTYIHYTIRDAKPVSSIVSREYQSTTSIVHLIDFVEKSRVVAQIPFRGSSGAPDHTST